MNTLNVGVVIARFQPLLREQIEHLLAPAIRNSDLVIVLLGSSGRARTCVDPLGNEDRERMIRESLPGTDTPLVFRPIRDFFYSETPVDWITQVQSAVNDSVKTTVPLATRKRLETRVTLYGAETDHDAKDFHGWFPHWQISLSKVSWMTSPDDEILINVFHKNPDLVSDEILTQETFDFLMKWLDTKEGIRLRKEYFYVEKYKNQTQTGKYPIIFQTVDNVCYYKGNILLVKRRSQPGKGLWALPGGFLDATESCRDGAVRELLEETRLRVKPEWLVSRDTFDHPRRSVRGRTITNAFLWKVPDSRNVPQVTAGSDAARVKWFPISEVIEEMHDQLFEDHLDIITTLIKRM